MVKVTGERQAKPSTDRVQSRDLAMRLRLFDQATDRQHRGQQDVRLVPADGDRGWSREDLYDRGRTR